MATKPVILAVDDDLPVLRAVERDLRARYGEQYRIVAANSGHDALEAVRQLTLRGSAVALFMVDQRMPQMTGIEFLAQAVELQGDARRVLLTAYADTDVAIKAINDIRLDHYILKPWDPPDEKLYPILDDLLSDWIATFPPALGGARAGRPLGSRRARGPGLPDPQPGPVRVARSGGGRRGPEAGSLARRERG